MRKTLLTTAALLLAHCVCGCVEPYPFALDCKFSSGKALKSAMQKCLRNLPDDPFCADICGLPVGAWDTSEVTSLAQVFSYSDDAKPELFQGNVGTWDTSNVTDMSRLGLCPDSRYTKMPDFGIGEWDTSKVTTMEGAFANCDAKYLNQDIRGWDTSNVTNMRHMFRDAAYFNQDISGWDTSNVTNMEQMFNGATKFDQDLSGWCVEKFASAPAYFAPKLKGTKHPVWGTCP